MGFGPLPPWPEALYVFRPVLSLAVVWSVAGPLDCDLDPLILRARRLHEQGNRSQALAVEEELQPIF